MEFRSSFATTWHLLYCIFSSVPLATHCDDKATTLDEMACRSTIWHNLYIWSLPLPRISVNPTKPCVKPFQLQINDVHHGGFSFLASRRRSTTWWLGWLRWHQWGCQIRARAVWINIRISYARSFTLSPSNSGSFGMSSILWSLRSTLKWWDWVRLDDCSVVLPPWSVARSSSHKSSINL